MTGPNRDGISAEKGWSAHWPAEGPKQLWKGKVGVGYSSVAVSNGRLYTMGNIDETDHVFCLEANTGKEVWKHSYPCSSRDPNGYPGTRCTPTVDGSRLFTVSREGHLFCLVCMEVKN
jgi:outer membrane protein assembly factor BamB